MDDDSALRWLGRSWEGGGIGPESNEGEMDEMLAYKWMEFSQNLRMYYIWPPWWQLLFLALLTSGTIGPAFPKLHETISNNIRDVFKTVTVYRETFSLWTTLDKGWGVDLMDALHSLSWNRVGSESPAMRSNWKTTSKPSRYGCARKCFFHEYIPYHIGGQAGNRHKFSRFDFLEAQV